MTKERSPSRGFTLIELMIVVAIVAVLAAIAYPAYKDSILKGKRAEGRTAVLDLLQQQERYLTQSNSYMRFGAGLTGSNGNVATTPVPQLIPFKTFSGSNASSSSYNVGSRTCQGGTSLDSTLRECVEVFATPNSTVSDPQVGTLWASSTGLKGCSGTFGTTNVAACWR